MTTDANDRGPGSLQAIFDAARDAEVPDAAVVDASWSEIERRQLAGAGPSVPVDVRGLPGFPGVTVPVTVKVVVLAVIAGTVGGIAWIATQRSDEQQPIGARAPSAIVEGASRGQAAPATPMMPQWSAPGDEPATQSAPAEVPATTRRARPTPAMPKSAEASRLAEETALLRRAWRALEEGRSTRVATVIAIHQREFPRGALLEEREAVRAVMKCNRTASEAARSAFERQYPGSVHAERVRRACRRKKDAAPETDTGG